MNKKPVQITLFLISIIMLTEVIPLSSSINWSPDMRLTWDEEWDTAASIIQASDGTIWVFWFSYRTGNAEIFYKIYDPFQTHHWSSEMQLTNNQSSDGTPYAMQASNGDIWVVWMTNRLGNYEIFCKTFNGTAWSTDIRLTNNTSRDELPAILQTTDGKIWVFWDSLRTGNYDIFYKTTIDNGANWTSATPVTSRNEDEWDPSVIETADGKVWLAYTRKDDIYFMTYDGIDWSSPERLTTDANDDWHPSILQDNTGNIWVFWDSDRISYEFPQTDIFYQFYDGFSWLPDDVQLTTDPDEDDMSSVIQDNGGNIWVLWSSDRDFNRDLYYRTDIILPAHDVEIFSVLPLNSSIHYGESVLIEVVARNHGTSTETIVVECYANETLIGTQTVSNLEAGQLYPVYFTLYSFLLTWGNYTISANATQVLGETNTDDNTFTDGILTIRWYDIAVIDVVPSKTVVGQGFTSSINVTVRNEGTQTETFSLTAHYNGTSINTQEVTLESGNSAIVVFLWNTTNVAKGKYTIGATAALLPNEDDVLDNTYTDGYVTVTIQGDVDGDRDVDSDDLHLFAGAYGSSVGDPAFNPNADINSDGDVDFNDLYILARNYGKSV